MPTLEEIQNGFQKAILEGDKSILTQIPDTPKEKNDVLLGIYQYAYSARLIEFLENDYPQLHAYLGDEQFDQLCRAYIAETPSHTPNARWYGNELPIFMENSSIWSEQLQLPELARLEYSLNIVFDASDEPLLRLDDLAQIPPEQWPSLVFSPVQATRRLEMETNVTDIWNALVTDQAPPDVQGLADPLQVLVYRDDQQSSFRSMSYEEAMMWDKMAAGVPFGVLCELMATWGGEDDAAMRAGSFLHGWISAGLITDQIDMTNTSRGAP